MNINQTSTPSKRSTTTNNIKPVQFIGFDQNKSTFYNSNRSHHSLRGYQTIEYLQLAN
jgi:hypothetical protein